MRSLDRDQSSPRANRSHRGILLAGAGEHATRAIGVRLSKSQVRIKRLRRMVEHQAGRLCKEAGT